MPPTTTKAASKPAKHSVPSLASPLRPRSGANGTARSSSASTARPFSSTNLAATVANARFKTFAVQYETLCKNPVLAEIAKEIPWKNLLDLFTLKFYAVGDVLWRQNEHPSELYFVLCGGFLVRHMLESPAGDGDPHHPHPDKHDVIIAETLVRPGASLCGYAVDQTTALRYTVVAAKFKSIALALPVGKYKSVCRQLSSSVRTSVQQLWVEKEGKLCASIKLTGPNTRPRTNPGSPMKRSASMSSLARPKSTPLASTDHSDKATTLNTSLMPSWDSLQVSKPQEYEVNSSLLILHQSQSTGNLHIPSTNPIRTVHSTSSSVRALAKKHATRRLQTIKLPATIDAFPPPSKLVTANMDEMDAVVLSQSASRLIDVAPKVRIGRLLAPLKKPATVEADEEQRWQPLLGRRVLVADRVESFREEQVKLY
ncbi:hypothetical protein Poli38472_008070 [Pythium oligandrum]|uniref:Cyclic nucleotide-binding domain-containing protein n=1 Tax=Pythium oligandrum TaxID=41045 RepID=A0A8K1FPA8_PYTOL|nr:hypothetical protein Poli38472_008070 [Pythium oligandrum]|eukprot:TMW65428.1 hypothetical protein Poli38472_008070 [Pythium oligandrum]